MRWALRLGCLLLTLTLVAEVSALRAQSPPRQPAPSYVGKPVFSLPVLLDQGVAGSLREIELYMRRKPEAPWQPAQTIRPNERAFVFKAPEDGEYQFVVVGVDKQGRRTVNNLTMKSPDSIIVVDSQAPHVDINVMGDTAEGVQISCVTVDANPNPLANEFCYQTRDGQWQRLSPIPGQTEQYCIPQAAAHTGMVRIVAKDRAGNPFTREMNVNAFRQLAAATPPPPAAPPPQPTAPPLMPPPAPAAPPVIPVVPEEGPKEPNAYVGKTLYAQTIEPKSELPPVESGPRFPEPPQHTFKEPAKVDVIRRDEPPVLTPPPELPPMSHEALRLPSQNRVDAPPQGNVTPVTAVETRQFINRPRVFLAYEVERAPSAATGKIQIWLTSDHGQSWQHGGEDADGRSPAEIRLPAEGIIGVRLAAGPGVQDAASEPVSWIELDVSKPIIDLQVRREATNLHITYAARDKNLAADPVDLYYRVDPQGPWLPIAAGQPASGERRWEIPETIRGRTASICVVASDLAGNTAQVEDFGGTSEPAAPPSAPRVRFLGVSSYPQ